MIKSKRHKNSLLNKMIIFNLSAIIIIFIFFTIFITYLMINNSINNTKKKYLNYLEQIAILVNDNINYTINILNYNQNIFSGMNFSLNTTERTIENLLLGTLNFTPQAQCVWLILDKGIYYEDKYFIKEYIKKDANNIEKTVQTSLLDCFLQNIEANKKEENASWYFEPLTTGELYFNSNGRFYNDTSNQLAYSTAISIPISVDNKRIGVLGVDLVHTNIFEKIDADMKKLQFNLMFLTQDMTIIHSSYTTVLYKNLTDLNLNNIDAIHSAFEKNIGYSGEIFSPIIFKKVFVSIFPILDDIKKPHPLYYLYISTPLEVIYAEPYRIAFFLVLIGFLSLIFLTGIVSFNTKHTLKPIIELTTYAERIAKIDYLNRDYSNRDSYIMPIPPWPLDHAEDIQKNEIHILQNAFIKMLKSFYNNLNNMEKSIKERTEQLYQQTKYISNIIQSETDIFMLFNKELNVVYSSNSIITLLELESLDDIIGKHLNDIHERLPDKEYVKRSTSRFSKIIAGEEYLIEYDVIIWPKIEENSYRIIYRRVTDDDNNFIGVVLYLNNITEIRLEEAQNRINEVVHSSLFPCQVWDKNGNLLALNRSTALVFGFEDSLSLDDFAKIHTIIYPKYQPDGKETEILRHELIKKSLDNGFLNTNIILNKIDKTPIYIDMTMIRIRWMSTYRIVVYYNDLTAEKQAEERIKIMFNATPLACCIWDENNNIIDCNNETIKIFDLPDKETFINNFYNFSPVMQPDGELTLVKGNKYLYEVSQKGIMTFNWLHQDINKNPIPCEITFISIDTTSKFLGKEKMLVSYIRDLREYNKLMLEKDTATERTQLMLDTMPLVSNFIDRNLKIIECNKEAIYFFNISSKEEYINNFYNFSPKYQPNGRLSMRMSVELLLDTFKNGYNRFEWVHQNKNGEPLPCEITLFRMKHNNDYFIISYARDLRDIKAVQDKIKKANDSVKIMLDSTPLICILCDEFGNIIDCNKETLNIFGVSDKIHFFHNFYDFFPFQQPDGSESIQKLNEIINTLLFYGSVNNFEWIFQTVYKEHLPAEIKMALIELEGVRRILIYGRDLRKDKENQQKILDSIKRENALIIQTKAAEAANEVKNRFLASVSHEIRTPMNAVLGIAELLLFENLNNRQSTYLKDIKISAMALMDIINDILDFSKIQSGKVDLICVHYDFKMFIDNIYFFANYLIQNKEIEFKLVIPDIIPKCLYGDDSKLRQILINLIGNAIKFTNEGSVSLIINVTDTTIVFTVSDTGIGILPEDIYKLFEPFEQIDSLKNRKHKGTGLGLPISKSLVELMNGKITLESVYGHGTSFHVEIPKIIGDETLIQDDNESEYIIYAPGAKILIVDDNKLNLNVASGLLQHYGIKTETAASGKEAMEMVKQTQYDIVFMDIMMPELDGMETTKLIRKFDQNLIIIALTASTSLRSKELIMTSGMNDYLSKPIIKKELIQMLNKWIPKEKLSQKPKKTTIKAKNKPKKDKIFWKAVEKIDGLHISKGLDIVFGQFDVYERSLRLLLSEIVKCNKNLNQFLSSNDMHNFSIEVHSMKGALANIGAIELSEKARELEMASKKSDIAFCVSNLPSFLEKLNSFNLELKNAFTKKKQSKDESVTISPELQNIFNKLLNAFEKLDIITISNEIQSLKDLNLSGSLKEKIEQIKDAVLIMDYESAIKIIKDLWKQP